MAANPCGSQWFSLNEEDFTVVHSQWNIFRKIILKTQKFGYWPYYEGILTVTDTELFCKALTEGIGRGKSLWYGFTNSGKGNF